MSGEVIPHPKTVDEVARALHTVRSCGYANIDLENYDKQSELAVLFSLVKGRYPHEWKHPALRDDALRKTLDDCIRQLPVTALPGSADTEMTWRKAAMILWQLEPPIDSIFEKIKLENPGTSQHYARLAIYVRDVAGLPPENKPFQSTTDKMRRNMATFLLKDEVKRVGDRAATNQESATENQTSATAAGEVGGTSRPTQDVAQTPPQVYHVHNPTGTAIGPNSTVHYYNSERRGDQEES